MHPLLAPSLIGGWMRRYFSLLTNNAAAGMIVSGQRVSLPAGDKVRPLLAMAA